MHSTDPESRRRKHIALVAHDHKKQDMLAWAAYNRNVLTQHELVATGTTGRLLSTELGLDVRCLGFAPGSLTPGDRKG